MMTYGAVDLRPDTVEISLKELQMEWESAKRAAMEEGDVWALGVMETVGALMDGDALPPIATRPPAVRAGMLPLFTPLVPGPSSPLVDPAPPPDSMPGLSPAEADAGEELVGFWSDARGEHAIMRYYPND